MRDIGASSNRCARSAHPAAGPYRLLRDRDLGPAQHSEVRDDIVSFVHRNLHDRSSDDAIAATKPLPHGAKQSRRRGYPPRQVVGRLRRRANRSVDDRAYSNRSAGSCGDE
jgi:hypothetical protein